MMPQSLRTKLEGWQRLMGTYGLPENEKTYQKLIAAYSEKHRAYHSLEHIDACFRHLDSIDSATDRPHEIELALWFHDVIYAPFSKTNEEDSAELAREFLSQNAVDTKVINRVYNLIVLTKGHMAPDSPDGEFMLDIDLSILGYEKHVYEQFEKDVRKEYKRVPSFIFKKKRKEILKSFSERPRLYHTDYFFRRLEVQAKINLKWAINTL